MRKQADNDFEKAFLKLMRIACFGKTMKNLRKRRNLKFVSSARPAKSLVEKSSFESFENINEKFVGVSFKMACVVWDKPTPVGAASLDLSKLFLYKLNYEVMIPLYTVSLLKLANKDTNSFLFQDMACFKHLLDLSEHPREHFLYDATNKTVTFT